MLDGEEVQFQILSEEQEPVPTSEQPVVVICQADGLPLRTLTEEGEVCANTLAPPAYSAYCIEWPFQHGSIAEGAVCVTAI